MGHDILRNILVEIHSARVFSILADETRDINNHEQMSFCIRWVDPDLVIHEDLIGIYHADKTEASFLVATIKDILLRCDLTLSLCRGQGYDGAANMMGHLHGVATVLNREEPRAVPVHCLARSLNLCLQDSAKICIIVRDTLSLIHEMCQLVCYSPKRQLLFNNLKGELSPQETGLRPLCPTRWTARTRAIEAVLNNYEALKQTFEEVNLTNADDNGRRAGGVFALMEKFDIYFGLKLCHLIFIKTEAVSSKLQAKDVTISKGLEFAELVRTCLMDYRSDAAFEHFYETVRESAMQYTSEPSLPRRRRAPKRLDDGSKPHFDMSPLVFFRRIYYEVIDKVSAELRRRFSKKHYKCHYYWKAHF